MFQRDEIKTSGAFEATIYEFFYLKIRIFLIFFLNNLLTFDRDWPGVLMQNFGLPAWNLKCLILPTTLHTPSHDDASERGVAKLINSTASEMTF